MKCFYNNKSISFHKTKVKKNIAKHIKVSKKKQFNKTFFLI